MRPAAGRITNFLGIGLLHRDGTHKRRVKGGHGIDVPGGSLVPQFLSRANCGRERVQQDTCTDGGVARKCSALCHVLVSGGEMRRRGCAQFRYEFEAALSGALYSSISARQN